MKSFRLIALLSGLLIGMFLATLLKMVACSPKTYAPDNPADYEIIQQDAEAA